MIFKYLHHINMHFFDKRMTRPWIYTFILSLIVMAPAAFGAETSLPQDNQSAVILAYFSVDDSGAEGSISPAQFKTQIEEIERGGFQAINLKDLTERLKNHEPIPAGSVAITFDGAQKSVITEAAPLLQEKNMPFTVFYTSDSVDSGDSASWDDLLTLSKMPGVTLGVMPSRHAALGGLPREEARRLLNKARQKHRDVFGREAEFLAYPYGQYTQTIQLDAEQAGFKAAFGQHSGPAHSGSDLYALPRFTQTETVSDIDRFVMTLHTLPLLVSAVQPADTMVPAGQTNPAIGFTVDAVHKDQLAQIKCFVSGQAEPRLEIISQRVELRIAEPLTEPRTRINCTLPGPAPEPDAPERWRWFGMLLSAGAIKPPSDAPQ